MKGRKGRKRGKRKEQRKIKMHAHIYIYMRRIRIRAKSIIVTNKKEKRKAKKEGKERKRQMWKRSIWQWEITNSISCVEKYDSEFQVNMILSIWAISYFIIINLSYQYKRSEREIFLIFLTRHHGTRFGKLQLQYDRERLVNNPFTLAFDCVITQRIAYFRMYILEYPIYSIEWLQSTFKTPLMNYANESSYLRIRITLLLKLLTLNERKHYS